MDLKWLLLTCCIAQWQLSSASSNSNYNPAEELADLVNGNRTAALVDNPGLACIALQYAHEFQQHCDQVDKEKPTESLYKSTFAAACGIEPSSVDVPLSGVLAYCQGTYVDPSQAFQLLLGNASQADQIINNGNHTQFGVAVASYEGGSPFYWIVLFSDSPSANSTFIFSNGKPLMQHEGCFSGTGQPCSFASMLVSNPIVVLMLVSFVSTAMIIKF